MSASENLLSTRSRCLFRRGSPTWGSSSVMRAQATTPTLQSQPTVGGPEFASESLGCGQEGEASSARTTRYRGAVAKYMGLWS